MIKVRRADILAILVAVLFLTATIGTALADKDKTIQENNFLGKIKELKNLGTDKNGISKERRIVDVGGHNPTSTNLTSYISSSKKTSKNSKNVVLVIPGQSLKDAMYSDMSEYFACLGHPVFESDRREAGILNQEQASEDTPSGSLDQVLRDTYCHVAIARILTAQKNHCDPSAIKVYVVGHSHGALIALAYQSSDYQNSTYGKTEMSFPVDIVVKFDPKETNLINAQKNEYEAVQEEMQNGIYYNSDMFNMSAVAYLAYKNPSGISPINPQMTNDALFMDMASNTYKYIEYPYVPNYCYWLNNTQGNDLEISKSVIFGKMFGENGESGFCPFSYACIDLYMAGLEGNIPGYDIDVTKIKVPVHYLGYENGFGERAVPWYINVLGNSTKVTKDMFSGGHGKFMECPEAWRKMESYMN